MAIKASQGMFPNAKHGLRHGNRHPSARQKLSFHIAKAYLSQRHKRRAEAQKGITCCYAMGYAFH